MKPSTIFCVLLNDISSKYNLEFLLPKKSISLKRLQESTPKFALINKYHISIVKHILVSLLLSFLMLISIKQQIPLKCYRQQFRVRKFGRKSNSFEIIQNEVFVFFFFARFFSLSLNSC